MKLKKPSIEVILIIVVLLALTIFILVNFKMLNKKIGCLREERVACKELDPGDECNFSLRGEEIKGICKEPQRGELVCRSENFFKRGKN
ncbi:hypothetical protein GF386_02085 [Candidatus Pacearchaeota archaeon]|nr:hypothetical protein [Candidatus Pacearchaeota archaeon]MBD3282957.1 hypothetical protein [Candidatus Pacearchaeota archaeon]